MPVKSHVVRCPICGREVSGAAARAVLVPEPRRVRGDVLTGAEVEVLRYLPSQLSFAEIGIEIGLPREQVKSLAISAYRKMGVVSRAEAVHMVQPTLLH